MTTIEKIAKLDKERWSRRLVSTRTSDGGWNHNVSWGSGVAVLWIYRFEGSHSGPIPWRLVEHPWSGKKWRYRTADELGLIRHLCDRIGLMVGSLKEI